MTRRKSLPSSEDAHELLVLPDRIELTRQSCLILILLYFSVRRSVFVWHSLGGALSPETTTSVRGLHCG